MIIFEMYLDGQLIDTSTPCRIMLRTKYNKHLKSLATELEKKHADLLRKAGSKPIYLLSGVQSCMNHFVPLCHPQNLQPSYVSIQKPAHASNGVPALPETEELQNVPHTSYKQLDSSKTKKAA